MFCLNQMPPPPWRRFIHRRRRRRRCRHRCRHRCGV